MGVKEKLAEYKRVLHIARKPSKSEFVRTSRISFSGIGMIGIIGFVIYLAFVLTGL